MGIDHSVSRIASIVLFAALARSLPASSPAPLPPGEIHCLDPSPLELPLSRYYCIPLINDFSSLHPLEDYTLVHHPPRRRDELQVPYLVSNGHCALRIDFHEFRRTPKRWELTLGLEGAAFALLFRCEARTGGRIWLNHGASAGIDATWIDLVSLRSTENASEAVEGLAGAVPGPSSVDSWAGFGNVSGIAESGSS